MDSLHTRELSISRAPPRFIGGPERSKRGSFACRIPLRTYWRYPDTHTCVKVSTNLSGMILPF